MNLTVKEEQALAQLDQQIKSGQWTFEDLHDGLLRRQREILCLCAELTALRAELADWKAHALKLERKG